MPTPNLSQNQKAKLYPQIQKLWPEICSNCGRTLDECNLNPFNPDTKTGGFEMHHTRYDLGMTNPKVIRFMCHSCNHKEEFSKSIILEHQNELSASHRSNLEKHPLFTQWFSAKMVENNYHMLKSEVINGGARVSGANVKTVGGWLKPIAESDESPFSIVYIVGKGDTVYLKGKEAKLEDFRGSIEKFNDSVDKSFEV